MTTRVRPWLDQRPMRAGEARQWQNGDWPRGFALSSQRTVENACMQDDVGTTGRGLSGGGWNHIKVASIRLLSKVARRVDRRAR